jgi:hypothetical protein
VCVCVCSRLVLQVVAGPRLIFLRSFVPLVHQIALCLPACLPGEETSSCSARTATTITGSGRAVAVAAAAPPPSWGQPVATATIIPCTIGPLPTVLQKVLLDTAAAAAATRCRRSRGRRFFQKQRLHQLPPQPITRPA